MFILFHGLSLAATARTLNSSCQEGSSDRFCRGSAPGSRRTAMLLRQLLKPLRRHALAEAWPQKNRCFGSSGRCGWRMRPLRPQRFSSLPQCQGLHLSGAAHQANASACARCFDTLQGWWQSTNSWNQHPALRERLGLRHRYRGTALGKGFCLALEPLGGQLEPTGPPYAGLGARPSVVQASRPSHRWGVLHPTICRKLGRALAPL